MGIVEATRRFEAWLRRRTTVVEVDLEYKHEQMRADPFLFFRATYYRWAQQWEKYCPKLAGGPEVYAVGDLHIENFGTWRDAEGRLVWGVNDFDEAHPMSFANDLVRLAVSGLLAARSSPHFKLKPEEICAQLAAGYRTGIEKWGAPFVLMESHPKLRNMAIQDLRQPAPFWQRMEEKTSPHLGSLPESVRKALAKILPNGAKPEYRILKHPKGLGSLGRRRYLALAEWQGGKIAREAKAVVASSYLWARKERPGEGNPWLERIVRSAVRCADPYYEVRRGWLVRRLAPDCSRIDMDQLVHHEELASLLFCMGQETANIHLGTPKAGKVVRKVSDAISSSHKSSRINHPKMGWLDKAAHLMLKESLKDWNQFRTSTEAALR
jgi:hypothetical protein